MPAYLLPGIGTPDTSFPPGTLGGVGGAGGGPTPGSGVERVAGGGGGLATGGFFPPHEAPMASAIARAGTKMRRRVIGACPLDLAAVGLPVRIRVVADLGDAFVVLAVASDDRDLLFAPPCRHERDVAPVGRDGWILVGSVAVGEHAHLV